MTGYEFGASASAGGASHIRRTGPSAAFWVRLAGTANILAAVVIYWAAVSYGAVVNGLISSVLFFAMLFGPSIGLVLILLPWVWKALSHPVKSAVPRFLLAMGLAFIASFASWNILATHLFDLS